MVPDQSASDDGESVPRRKKVGRGKARTGTSAEGAGETPAGASTALPGSETPPAGEAVPPAPAVPPQGERLHKFLASTGAGSRRECETFIAQGRVTVNGKVVTKMGVRVEPTRDVVTLDGERVKQEDRVYYLLHKPVGFVSTSADERGRPRVIDLVRDRRHRVYTVGRLDVDSTGLMLLTNDGEIANVICHPRYRIEKTYQVTVRGEVTRETLAKVEAGVWLAEGKSSPAKLRPVGRNPRRDESILEMTLYEGRNREIRRVFARVGLKVRRLHRVRLGPLTLGDLPSGVWRELTPDELRFVKEAESLYLANREAWDAELPPPEVRRGGGRRPRPRDARGGGRTHGGRPEGGRPQRGVRRFGGGGGGGGGFRGGGFRDGGGRPPRGEGPYGRPFREDAGPRPPWRERGPARRDDGHGSPREDRPPIDRPRGGSAPRDPGEFL